MTKDQDTPVVASSATDQSSQEVSKPKRTTTRSKASTAPKTAAGKTTRKTTSKAADSPAKTSAPKAADAKPAKTAPKKSTKTAKVETAEAAKPKAAPKSAARSSARTSASTSKTKAAAHPKADAQEAPAATAGKEQNATSGQTVAAEKAPKTASKSTGRRSAAKTGANKADAVAKSAEQAANPQAANAGVSAATTTDDKTSAAAVNADAKSAPAKPAAKGRTGAAKTPRKTAPKSSKAASTGATAKGAPHISGKTAIPAANAPVAATAAAAPSQAEAVTAVSTAPAAPQGSSPAAQAQTPARAEREAASESGEASAQVSGESSGEVSADAAADAPRRKNRRGRRGGRGRNRKKEQNGQDTAVAAVEPTAEPTAAAPDATAEADAAKAEPTGNTQSKRPQGDAKADKNKNAPAKAAQPEKARSEAPKGKRRMFISVLPGEQVEVALAEDGMLLEYYLDMLHQRKIKGNIYKGVIHNIDTNLQAAFVSYGSGKNGFLQIDEVHPEYWLTHHEPTKGKKFPPIQKVLKPGQEVLVQVVKEPTGSKGAFLTTWLSLAGRFLVLTPGQDQIGVSRKVDDDEERARLREMMNGIDPGQGLGVIVRTVSAGTTKTTLKNDLQYLKRVWRDIRKKATEVSAPSLIYQEPGLSERAVRDYLTEDVSEIWVDNDTVAQGVREMVNLLFPRRKDLVRLHTDSRTPMWERFNLRRQLEQIYSREVLLPSGGRLVFDQTEALMAIDINSGKISGKGNFEAMAHKTNMEAAETIARHLKLRDIGGQVVIDFIEMRDKKHVMEVEKTLRTAMKNDRARHDVARMSSFGLLELVRQRTGSSALSISMEPCPACAGTGMRRNIEWQALQALREVRRMMNAETKEKCVYPANPELALYLLNHKRDTLRELEQEFGKCLEIMVRP